MTTTFADAFFYLALVNPGDLAHGRAVAFSGQGRVRVVTTAWVITEVADALCAPAHRPTFLNLLSALRSDPYSEITPPDAALFDRGLDLYARRPDKGWSLTDCLSFVVMGDRGLTDALTGDRHFEQAGFVALLRTP